MKRVLRFFIFLVSIFFGLRTEVIAQTNLVPNWSFDTVNYCNVGGSGGGGLYYGHIPPWDSPTNGSPDEFNSCVPNFLNSWGFQLPHSGNGYSGGGFYEYTGIREYLQIELNSTLIQNKSYCASFYVNLADRSHFACNNIGMYFSATHTFIATTSNLSFIPQIVDTSIITDSTNWINISGEYTAQGGERYIIIGNFSPNNLTDTIQLAGLNGGAGYYYIDDVSVFEITNGNASAGRDTTICHGDSVQLGVTPCQGIAYSWQPTTGLSNPTISNPRASPHNTTSYYLTQTTPCTVTKDTIVVTMGNCTIGINEWDINKEIKLYPNPNNGEMQLSYQLADKDNGYITIYDLLGQKINTYKLINGATILNISEGQLIEGMYYYQVFVNGNKVYSDKIIIIK